MGLIPNKSKSEASTSDQIKHGGKRAGSGRKREYQEETDTISFRVPKSLIAPITEYVKEILKKEKTKKNKNEKIVSKTKPN